MKKLSSIFFILLPCLGFAQQSIELIANKDNSLFSEANNLSNGAGDGIFAGKTGGGNIRRALLQFPINQIPQNVSIDSVQLTLTCDNARSNAAFKMYRLLSDWGEGSSVGNSNGGKGGTATTNDATWTNTFFNTQNWNTPGGDFNADSLVCSFISIQYGKNTFTSKGLLENVRNWYKNSYNNFGWIILGNENNTYTAHKFASRENSIANQPQLKVFYSPLTSLENYDFSTSKSIYPNPANDFVSVPYFENTPYSILNLQGQLVQNGDSFEGKINVQNLKSGFYILKFNHQNELFKLIIEK